MQILVWSIFFIQIKVIKSYDDSPYNIFDQSFTSSSFGSLEGWAVYNGASTVSDCGPYRILGGLGNFAGTTIQKNLIMPAIYELKITATVLLIDSWDGEYFKVYVNDQEYYSLLYGQIEGTKICGNFPCGSSQCVTTIQTIEIIVHQQLYGNVKISMQAFLDEDASNESWGIRDIRIWGKLCPTDCGLCENYIY